MMYLVSAMAVGAAGMELRNLAVDQTNNKIQLKGHGLTVGDLVTPSATVANLTVNRLYAVSANTDNDFQLKAVDDTLAPTGDAVDLNAAIDGAKSLTKVGTKKCKLTGSKNSGDGTDPDKFISTDCSFALTDELKVYCSTNAACAPAKNAATLGEFESFYAINADANKFKITKTAPTWDLATAKYKQAGTPVTWDTDHGDLTTHMSAGIWVVSVDRKASTFYPEQTKDLERNVWVKADKNAICNSTCPFVNDNYYYYTGSTAGLTDGALYQAGVASATPWKFTLNTAKVTAATGALAEDAAAAIEVTNNAYGKYQRIDNGRLIENTKKTDNKVQIKGNNSSNEIAQHTVLMYYCTSTTAADCAYNIAGATNGATFKVKSVPTNAAQTHTTVDLKTNDSAGTDVSISADSAAGATKGYTFTVAGTDTPIVFPAGTSPPGAGSAARSFAMFGSAVAMATAFLLA